MDLELHLHIYPSDFENKDAVNKLWNKIMATHSLFFPHLNLAITFSNLGDIHTETVKTLSDIEEKIVMFYLGKILLQNFPKSGDFNNLIKIEKICCNPEVADFIGVSFSELKRIFRENNVFDYCL